MTRRRRECDRCNRRYTTYERVEQVLPYVIKKDGRRETFDRAKVLGGLRRATVKRPVSIEALERVASELEHALAEEGEQEVSSARIGERLLSSLRPLDQVAYVRFASVYRDFQDAQAFVVELSNLIDHGAK